MRFRNLTITTAVFTYLTILVGGYTRGSGAGYGCRDAWPLCEHPVTGQMHLFPDWTNSLMVIEWSHRFVALIAGIFILWTAIAAWRHHRHDTRAVTAATIAGVLLPIQALLGAATVWYFTTTRHGLLATFHMGTAAALFSAVVATAIFAYYPREPTHATAQEAAAGRAGRPAKEVVRDYARMLKPRIIGLLAAMGYTGIVLAPGGPELSLVQVGITLVGGGLAAASAGVINQVIERDLDAKMPRTHDRPVATGRVSVAGAMAYALILAAISFTMMAWMVNVLAAVLTQVAILLYVFVYTLWLKPTTPQGVVVGGAAGSVPALVGWAAVTGEIGTPALLLGVLVFLWQPPHFWALAIAKRKDYGAAGFPMMPNVRGLSHTKKQMLLYTVATVLVAIAFYPLGYLGTFYLVASTVLGVVFLAATIWVLFERGERHVYGLFLMSVAYLGLLFVSIVVDRLGLVPGLA